MGSFLECFFWELKLCSKKLSSNSGCNIWIIAPPFLLFKQSSKLFVKQLFECWQCVHYAFIALITISKSKQLLFNSADK